MSYDYNDYKDQQTELGDRSFGGRQYYLDKNKADGPVEFLQFEPDKKYVVDIIPFKIAGENYPKYERLKLKHRGKKDIYVHMMELWVHKNVGPGGDQVVCPKMNYNKPCPICDDLDAQIKAGGIDKQDEIYTTAKAKQRGIFVVIDKLDEGKMKILDYPYFWFAKNLDDKLKNIDADEEQVFLYDISEKGKSIRFVPSKSTGGFKRADGSTPAGNITDITFVARKHGYDNYIVDEAIQLDKLINIKSYDEIEALYTGANVNEDDEIVEERVEEEKVAEETVETPVVDIAEKASDLDERAARRARIEAKRKAAEEKPSCPYGMTFGVDNMKTLDCDNKCADTHPEIYEACTKEWDRLNP